MPTEKINKKELKQSLKIPCRHPANLHEYFKAILIYVNFGLKFEIYQQFNYRQLKNVAEIPVHGRPGARNTINFLRNIFIP